MELIKLLDITKEFDGQVVLRGIDLSISQNEFVTLLGPSGCGKTTLLRIIGGFVEPSNGVVTFDDVNILNTPAYLRPTNTVFQRYSLFPHLDVFENVAFGLRLKNKEIKKSNKKLRKKMRKTSDIDEKNTLKLQLQNKVSREKDIEVKVAKYLKMVGLAGYENRNIQNLSGGQQQRVAIARALINEPKVLLLDEPLAALDLKLRQEMQYELKEIQRNAGITFIFVTHDQEEALTMSDKIVVMSNGEIQQIGSPEDIYNEPANKFVANFIGESNIISGIMKDDFLVEFDGKEYKCVDNGFKKNAIIDVVLRPEDIDIKPYGEGKISGVIDSVIFKGVHWEIDVMTDKRTYLIHTTDYVALNTKVDLDFGPEDIHVMEVW